MKQAYKIGLMALVGAVSLLAAGCVREDLTKCPPAVNPQTPHTLKVQFAPGQLDVVPTGEDMKLAVVYVYDEAGNLVTAWSVQNPALDTAYDTGIVLDDGKKYRVVTWINPQAPYDITPAYKNPTPGSPLGDGRLSLGIPQSGTITDLIPMLLYGSATQVVAPTDNNTVVSVPMTLDTYHLNITLEGLPLDGSTYQLKITDSNGVYDFDNNFVQGPEFSYINTVTASTGGGTGNLSMALNTLRLAAGRSPQISIVNTTTGKTVFPQNGATSINLMDLIAQTGIDPSKTHNFDIKIPVPTTDSSSVYPIELTINGWNVVIEDYDVNPN